MKTGLLVETENGRSTLNRRRFLQSAAAAGAIAPLLRAEEKELSVAAPAPFQITSIHGTPGERGRTYGAHFREAINAFLDREIYAVFVGKPSSRDELTRYAAGCAEVVRDYSPEIHEELTGIAEGAGITRDEAVLITLHEELYHRSLLPQPSHCTAVAVGPPATVGKSTFVGQTWDWMPSVAGLSTMLEWRRQEGPSVLAYAFPGLWVGAGLNSAGIALCWTSADLDKKDLKPRVGLPSYVLLAHLLYQESLEAVIAEARRAVNAGWFTFVLADGEGRLLNVEGSPRKIVTEEHCGALARVSYGSREMTQTASPRKVAFHPRCEKMFELIDESAGKIDREAMQRYFADPRAGICVGPNTLDLMVFETAERKAWLSRGESYGIDWRMFEFSSEPAP